MSLYRKYRPSKWSDVVGQDQVVAVLKSAISDNSVSHAYLLSGSRGIGKTSIARIFAHELATAPVDLYELDAASNRGIDEIRDLRESVRTLPFESKYKIYIIDEVHMLTGPAFNALLKTLEEPPPHVIFILATTEAHKLPQTIVSRCQVLSLKRPSEISVESLILRVAKAEGYSVDKEAITLMAILSDGAYRDALTLLEKVLTISSKKSITASEVELLTGTPKVSLVINFTKYVFDGDKTQALLTLHNLREQDVDMKVFTKFVMRLLRSAMLLNLAPDLKVDIASEHSQLELDLLAKLSVGEGTRRLPDLLRALLRAYEEIPYAYVKTLPLELAVVELDLKSSVSKSNAVQV